MGEIFARPLPAQDLEFTGERLTSELAGQTAVEHLHRYMLAREFCRGRRVLDVASGEGYGAAMLAQVAASVIGIEIDSASVMHAEANYAGPTLRFLRGEARAIPLADASVDVAISFETIEHFDRQDDFVAELHRVLQPGGLLIVSTPDRDTYSPMEQPANPYHAHELTREEFRFLLGHRFANVAMCWQRALSGSALLPGPNVAVAPEAICFERRGSAHFEASSGFPRPRYLLALCSDAALPAVPPSVYIDQVWLDAQEQVWQSKLTAQENAWQAMLAAERERYQVLESVAGGIRSRLDDTEALLRATLDRAASAEATLGVERARSESAAAVLRIAECRAAAAEEAARAAAESVDLASAVRHMQESSQRTIDALNARIAALLSSSSWRITAPLRRLVAMFSRSRH